MGSTPARPKLSSGRSAPPTRVLRRRGAGAGTRSGQLPKAADKG